MSVSLFVRRGCHTVRIWIRQYLYCTCPSTVYTSNARATVAYLKKVRYVTTTSSTCTVPVQVQYRYSTDMSNTNTRIYRYVPVPVLSTCTSTGTKAYCIPVSRSTYPHVVLVPYLYRTGTYCTCSLLVPVLFVLVAV